MSDPLFWLYADNYRTYNVDVARKLRSIDAAILLSELASRHRYHRDRNELDDEGLFYYTHEDVEERTCLSRKNQDTAIGILVKAGLIQKIVKGVPPRRYFKLNIQAIYNFFFEGAGQIDLSETDKLNCPKRTNQNVRNGQIGHIYNKPKEEPKEDMGGEPPPPICSTSSAETEQKEAFGELGHVRLTQKEHTKLLERLGKDQTTEMIKRLDLYVGQTGKKYKSHYATILKWLDDDDKTEKKNSASPVAKHRQGSKLAFETEKDTWKPPEAKPREKSEEEKARIKKEYGVDL